MKVSNILVASVLALATCNVSAGTVSLTDGTGFLNGTEASGGAFIVESLTGYNGQFGGNGVTGDKFATFCLERDEFISLPGGPYTSSISTSAADGGIGGPSPDPISEATALLYSTFRTGGLINGQLIDTSDEVSALQFAIWSLEEEGNPGGLPAISALASSFQSWATGLAPIGSGNFYNVRVLNLSTGSTLNQSMLTLVPLPTAAWMGLGLLGSAAGVSYARRRSILA